MQVENILQIGKGSRGRPERRFMDGINEDMKTEGAAV